MERPLVVVYRMAPVSYLVARLLLKVDHVSLVNLLLDKAAVPELIQHAMSPERIAAQVRRLWDPGAERDAQIQALRQLREVLGRKGAASRAAEEVVALIRS